MIYNVFSGTLNITQPTEAGKVTVELAMHWPPVKDLVVYSWQGDEHPAYAVIEAW